MSYMSSHLRSRNIVFYCSILIYRRSLHLRPNVGKNDQYTECTRTRGRIFVERGSDRNIILYKYTNIYTLYIMYVKRVYIVGKEIRIRRISNKCYIFTYTDISYTYGVFFLCKTMFFEN